MIGFTPVALAVPSLTPLQPSNCTLYVLPSLTIPMPLVGTRYASQFALSIPMNTALVGLPFQAQYVTWFRRLTSTDQFFRFTNRGDMVIGV